MSDLDEERESQSGDYEPDEVSTDDDERPLDEDEDVAEEPVLDSERVVVIDDDLG